MKCLQATAAATVFRPSRQCHAAWLLIGTCSLMHHGLPPMQLGKPVQSCRSVDGCVCICAAGEATTLLFPNTKRVPQQIG